jgi:hypothetical protein
MADLFELPGSNPMPILTPDITRHPLMPDPLFLPPRDPNAYVDEAIRFLDKWTAEEKALGLDGH